MRVIWILDNKYRELYGLYDLKKKLKESNIDLIIINKFNWKASIQFFSPNIVIIPNIKKESCLPILDYCDSEEIKVVLHSSEGMFYSEYVQSIKYNLKYLDKLEKIFSWSKNDSDYLVKNNYENKNLNTGILKLCRINQKKQNNKIQTIGIFSSLRYLSSYLKSNPIFQMKDAVTRQQQEKIGLLKIEFEYIEFLSKFINKYKDKYRIILKIHPYESYNIYKEAFKEIEISKERNLRIFFKQIDLSLTMHSSLAVDSLKFNIPVVSMSRCIKWNEELFKLKNFGPNINTGATSLGIAPKKLDEFDIILEKNIPELLDECNEKGKLNLEKFVYDNDTVEIMSNFFFEYSKKNKKKTINILFLPKLLLTEIRQEFFRGKREQLYKFWKFKDINLLKKFRL